MKKLILVLFLISLNSFAIEYKVNPYLILSDKKDLILKFQLKKKSHLKLEVDRKIIKDQIFEAKVVQEVNLGENLCGKEISIDSNDKQIDFLNFPCDEEITFGFLGDTQKHPERHSLMSHEVERYPLSFVINLGDLVENGMIPSEWEDFFNSASPYSKKTPMVAAVGNHEFKKILGNYVPTEDQPLPKYFKDYFRWEGAPELGFYSIEFKQFTLVVFNSNLTIYSKEKLEKQWNWVEETLKKNFLENKRVILGMHHSPFSSDEFYSGKEAVIIRDKLVPLLEKYKVKAVLTGHCHLYERSFVNGIHYIVTGPSGGTFRCPVRENPYMIKVLPEKMTFGLVKVNSNEILVKIFDQENNLLDEVKI
ncbi:MAG: metallophosphoesterase family protein [Bacteriovoracales bacterium]